MKKLLICYSHFAPAFKAGGPVQSLVNLAELLRHRYSVYVICSAYDLGDESVLKGVRINQWNTYAQNIEVFYIAHNRWSTVKNLLQELKPDIVYINGMFLPDFNWYPLILSQRQKCKIVIAPRGMLQQGALAIRSRKKEWFLRLFSLFGFYKNVTWHATDAQEKKDIQTRFGQEAIITVASNIPRQPLQNLVYRIKQPGQLRLVYLSLITEKKNLHLILEALKDIKDVIQFDIYGPIKDEIYWKECQRLMNNQRHKIRYCGAIEPDRVQQMLSTYHVLILPTKGENFGHAVYDAFSAGTPAIISPFTPWGDLKDASAGETVDLSVKSLSAAINRFIEYDEKEFNRLSLGAYNISKDYLLKHDFDSMYKSVFD